MRPEPSPDDYDFPCSALFRAFSFTDCGRRDPGWELPISEVPPRIIYRRRPIDDKIDQLKTRVIHIETEQHRHLALSAGKKIKAPSKYKGLRK